MAIFIFDFDVFNPNDTPDQWRNLFTKLWNEQHKVAVVSFPITDGISISDYLTSKLGLSENEVKRTKLCERMPAKRGGHDLNDHIFEVLADYKHLDMAGAAVLVAVDIDKLWIAYDNGYSVVEASENGAHFNYVEEVSELLKASQKEWYTSEYKKRGKGWAYGNTIPNTFANVQRALNESNDSSLEYDMSDVPLKIIIAAEGSCSLDKLNPDYQCSIVITPQLMVFDVDEKGKATLLKVDSQKIRECLLRNKLEEQLKDVSSGRVTMISNESAELSLDIEDIIHATYFPELRQAIPSIQLSCPTEDSTSPSYQQASNSHVAFFNPSPIRGQELQTDSSLKMTLID